MVLTLRITTRCVPGLRRRSLLWSLRTGSVAEIASLLLHLAVRRNAWPPWPGMRTTGTPDITPRTAVIFPNGWLKPILNKYVIDEINLLLQFGIEQEMEREKDRGFSIKCEAVERVDERSSIFLWKRETISASVNGKVVADEANDYREGCIVLISFHIIFETNVVDIQLF